MSTTKQDLTAEPRRLTRDEAQDAGLIPKGHGWDEESQAPAPIGALVLADRIERGVDLTDSFRRLEKNQALIRRMIADGMQEAEYKPDGYPVAGRMHDFYRLPNYDKKVLTKQGAEKLALFARLRRSRTQSTERQCTKEFAMAVVQVDLVDAFGQPAGSGEAACTTAEVGFKKAAKKYGDDFRAALNDVIARAGKRAFVQALVYATATDEMFDTTGTGDKTAEAHGATEDVYRLPASAKLGSHSGRLVKDMTTEELTGLRDRMLAKAKDLKTWQPVIDAINEELESRREPADDGLPF